MKFVFSPCIRTPATKKIEKTKESLGEHQERARRMRWAAAFSSSPVATSQLGLSLLLFIDYSHARQSLMEPHMPLRCSPQQRCSWQLHQHFETLSNVASNFGALGQPSPATSALPVSTRQQLRRSFSTSPATSALPVNLASNFGASWSTSPATSAHPGQHSPATSALLLTSPATSALPVNLASNFAHPGQPRQQHRRILVNLRQQPRRS